MKEVESGKAVKEVCREQGVSEQTIYRWPNKYSGLDLSDLRRLKHLVADQAMDIQILKEINAKKW